MLAEKEQRAEGETYFLADARPYTINEIAETIAKEAGKQLPIPHMPFWVANILSIGLLIPSKLFGFTSPLTRNTVKELKNNWFVDIKKAQLELGYQPMVELKDGVKKTVEWFMNDYLAKHNN
jgi:nucleoside-diphosphate-sugar epimerase